MKDTAKGIHRWEGMETLLDTKSLDTLILDIPDYKPEINAFLFALNSIYWILL